MDSARHSDPSHLHGTLAAAQADLELLIEECGRAAGGASALGRSAEAQPTQYPHGVHLTPPHPGTSRPLQTRGPGD